jgi:hypothetical protein
MHKVSERSSSQPALLLFSTRLSMKLLLRIIIDTPAQFHESKERVTQTNYPKTLAVG